MNGIRRRYNYGVYDGDDLAQEAYLIGMEVIESYDPSIGPLFNYLSVAVNNGIKNVIRRITTKSIDTISLDNLEEEILKIGNTRTSYDEFWNVIDDELAPEYRSDYLKARQGIKLTKTRKNRLITELSRIVNDNL